METHISDLSALDAFARTFASGLAPGTTVALSGPLGTGKTTLIRALVRALHGSDEAVSSPTFVLRQRYDGVPPIEHLDLYRIEDPTQVAELGLDDAFAKDRITFVEWPEQAASLLPSDTIYVHLSDRGSNARTILVEERGS